MKKQSFLTTVLFIVLVLSTLNLFAEASENLKVVPVYPQNNSVFVSKRTTLLFSYKGDEVPNGFSINVTCSKSGLVEGKIKILTKENRLIFIPAQEFIPGEIVDVRIDINSKKILSYSFGISPKKKKLLSRNDLIRLGYLPPENRHYDKPATKYKKSTFNGLPADFPDYYVSVINNPGPGYYFVNAGLRDSTRGEYNLIIDTTGFPVFYMRFPPDHRENFFTYHPSVGLLTYYDQNLSKFSAYNNSNEFMRYYDAQNGYSADIHELILNEDGTYWLLAYDAQNVDMSQIYPGGCETAVVIGTIIQGIDGDDNVFFQWSSWDHFNITDADTGIVDLTRCMIDYCHGNALAFDSVGNVILSSRNMSEITKIDRQTGNIIWRLGGNNNQFTFVNDTVPIKAQHHIRYRGNNTYSLFDNGNSRVPPFSRAITYQLDEQNLTATLKSDFQKYNPADFTPFMGSNQLLDNGVHLVGWAANYEQNVLTQYKSDGEIQFEIMGADTFELTSYRALKFQWETSLFDFDKDTLDFGTNTPIGQTSYRTLCITNPPSEPLTLHGFYSTDSSFSLENIFPFTIPANSCDSVTISFTPTGTTPVSAAFSIYYQPTDTIRISKQLRVLGGGIVDRINKLEINNNSVVIKPNPFHNACTVTLRNGEPVRRILVFTTDGKLIKTIENKGKTPVHIEGLKKGVYFIKVSGTLTTTSSKIIVE